jgi:alkaline phosphatase
MRSRLLAILGMLFGVIAEQGHAQAPKPDAAAVANQRPARNVILFLGDGTGLSTIHAASVHGYGEPQKLYIQRMPHLAFSETSSASRWVTDSAAGMTAIVTGEKTHNGVISQSDDAVRGKKDGRPLKTILEYAEEKGLLTGVVTNSPLADATPAATYAHANERATFGQIFRYIVEPCYGDGVDVAIGPGAERIIAETQALGIDLPGALQKKGYRYAQDDREGVRSAAADKHRLVGLFSSEDEFDLELATDAALDILERSERGFFLMVESNNHSRDVLHTLDRAVKMDRLIEEVAERMKGTDTLILFTADHSYDMRMSGTVIKGESIVPSMVVQGSHAGEEVLVAAQGPGAEKVRGFMRNTQLFDVMMDAFGWEKSSHR